MKNHESTSEHSSAAIRLPVVVVRQGQVKLPTYSPAPPDKNPMFLEQRVYQGSSGKVYPLPFTDRIATQRANRKWQVIWLENEYLQVMILPELGGRIHRLLDKTNGYDAIYYQPVIKPALVGLAGPWISGGIEFNWPQHHRPATFLPVDTHIERHPDGAITVWCSDHDPMCRMKGMHGICLHPGRAYLELKVRAYNRTPLVQTFLWWANVATRVHAGYQSFFPPDVHYVADHAKRAMSAYPLCQGRYYGVDYGRRREAQHRNPTPKNQASSIPPSPSPGDPLNYPPNDLSWYANIPVPTSYMCMGSQEDFFGGYDHFAQAGILHIADHHIAPGKKQWTWGNHEFGYAWDRNLTDPDAAGEWPPYIELMAGVFTDNQPDFSFLQPGETKTWSQFWYPIQQIGPAHHANLHAAVSLRHSRIRKNTELVIGVSVSVPLPRARILLTAKGKPIATFTRNLAPGKPFIHPVQLPKGILESNLTLSVIARDGHEIIAYSPQPARQSRVPSPATEPPPPDGIASADELFVTGLHLRQYRHATRCPTVYWREALRRDPLDARCNNALGLWHLQRGEWGLAEPHFRNAIARLTRRNPNPYDGEPYYHLGLCLRHQLAAEANAKSELANPKFDTAYAAFAKAAWNAAWAAPAYHALAELDCRRADWATALAHADQSLAYNPANLRARNLSVLILRNLGRRADAAARLRKTLAVDPLDWWARHLMGKRLTDDAQTQLDLAHDYAHAGFYTQAVQLLEQCRPRASVAPNAGQSPLPTQSLGTAPLIHYTLGWLHEKLGHHEKAARARAAGLAADPAYCFPARLEEIAVFESALRANPRDARAHYYLGNLFYDRRRHGDAIRHWERSARLAPAYSVVWRNLGIAYFNAGHQPAKARAAYDRAFRADPTDARLLYERDQLWKRLGETPARRLRALERHLPLVRQRDDLSVELCALYNLTGRPQQAVDVLAHRHFQPWEGGEGLVLEQHVRAHLALGRNALAQGDPAKARDHFLAALAAPPNLGEAKHLLANESDIHYWLGEAFDQLHEPRQARRHWRAAAAFKGDFQEMRVRTFSEMTYYSALSWRRLGRPATARKLFGDLLAYAQGLRDAQANLDYFATSLPALLLFEDDLQFRQATTARFLEAQARWGLGQKNRARRLLAAVLQRDPNHARAAEFQETFKAGARGGKAKD